MASTPIRWALATAVAAGTIAASAVAASADEAAPTAVPTMIGTSKPDKTVPDNTVPSNVDSGVGVDTSAPLASKILLGTATPVALGGVVLFIRRRRSQRS